MRTPVTAPLVLGLAAALHFAAGPAWSQDATEPDAEEAQFSADDLDALVAPVALYPDSLLAQVMVAATFPLDVMKADRFVDDNADLSADARADAAEGEDWDPSIQVLASGFPTVIDRMADEIDWTEQLGDAVLVQTDDVLDAVQRMRAQAAATGYLATNDAQVVDVVDDSISIEPADPDVVYVPTYDPAMAFTTAPTAAPIITTDQGLTTTDLITTGAIAFGSAFLINEIFDDDDDWDNYWRGPSHIDWDDGDFNPRPSVDVDVDGDVNINRGRFTNVDRDRVDIDRGRLGDHDGEALQNARDRGWKPSADRQAAARDNIAATKRNGGAGLDSGRADAARSKLKARSAADDGAARAKLQKAAADRTPSGAVHRPDTALKPKAASAPDVSKAKARAAASGKAPQIRKAAAARPKPAAKPKAVSRPQAATRPAAKRPPPKASAFKKSGGGRPKAAAARGNASKSRRR